MLYSKNQQLHKGVETFNNSLVSNEKYIEKIKQRIQKIKENLSRENQFCDQIKWKILLE